MKPPVTLQLLVTAIIITSCAPLDVAAPKVATLTLPKTADRHKLEAGREIYASSCTRCHGPARIDRRSDEKWSQKVLPDMCKKAKLTPEQTAAVTAYVMTARHAIRDQAVRDCCASKGNG
jgi:mono/diheme cytochrome c family protein